MVRVAILGATGYSAKELIRLLLAHPEAKITALTTRHARAISGYASALAMLATRLEPGPAMEALASTRDEAVELGERLRLEIGLEADAMEPFRPVDARVGLRPAFAAEMATYGWRIRQQLEIQAAALARLEADRGGQSDEALQRLRWAIAYLRAAFEQLTSGEREAMGEIRQALCVIKP